MKKKNWFALLLTAALSLSLLTGLRRQLQAVRCRLRRQQRRRSRRQRKPAGQGAGGRKDHQRL